MDVVPVIRELEQSIDWESRRSAAVKLGSATGEASFRALVRALEDPEPSVVRATIASLQKRGEPEAVLALLLPKTLHQLGGCLGPAAEVIYRKWLQYVLKALALELGRSQVIAAQ